MDSKRKVNGGSALVVEDMDDRAAKRRKLPSEIDLAKGETAETTTQYGLTFLEQIKKTTDKSGRLVATNFLQLPNKRQLPDYYRIIKMPIALDTIESRLSRREFPNLTTLESYFKRMITNAKEYNEKGSEIYEDAERLRKALSNFMTKNNPAYKTTGYIAFPTPLPGEDVSGGSDIDAEGEVDPEVEAPPVKRKPGRPPKNPAAHAAQRLSTTPTTFESRYAGISYSGLTFQQAQEKIVADMIRHKEDPEDEFSVFEPFVNLPPRSLKDYYQVIPNPVSLKGLQKHVKGIQGRNDATGVSIFKTWSALEEETSFIWKNAWHYNEDGSDISNLAKDLQTFFYKSLQEARQAVPEPATTKIKLKMSSGSELPAPKITLRMGAKSSPADSPAPHANGMNGDGVPVNDTAQRRNPFGGSYSSSTPVPNLGPLEKARSLSGSVASPTPSTSAVVKNEDGARQSPALSQSTTGYNQSNYRGTSQAVSTPTLTVSGMPPPASTPGLPNHNHYFQSNAGHTQPYNPYSAYHSPNTSFESKWRQPGKDASDAMITNLSLATHPGLNISRHFRMDLPPSATMTQQSITINLPSTHYYLQIKPTIAAPLLERQYKLFVTSGTQRLHAMPTIPGHAVDPRHPLFEARLLPGVNRIEVELIAALPKGAAKPATGQDVELEKITVFANLMRS